MNELRPYQREDVYKLHALNSCALFNEQRTGKTPTALTLLKEKGCKKILIITTASSQYQWKAEYEKWMDQPCVICAGTKIKKNKLLGTWTDGLVVSIDSFKPTKRSDGLLSQILKLKPDAIVLDEAHKIKDPKSANAKAIFQARKIPVRIALTGTPAPNKPYDIFSILSFLHPEKYPSFWRFLDEFFQIEDQFVWTKGGKKTFKTYDNFKGPEAEKRLQDEIALWSTNRKRQEVMPWLPKVFKEQVKLECTKEQLKYLTELDDTYETEHVITVGNLDRLTRCRQICVDPKLLDLPSESPKTDYLLQYIQDNPDESIIVFSKFSSYLKTLITVIPENYPTAMIVGDVPIAERNEFVKKFQNGTYKCLLLNIDCCKESLTLDQADTTIFLDKFPPVGDIEQAEARFVATTLEKRGKPHKIIELMMTETYDERIYDLLKLRKSKTDIINDYANERRKRHVQQPSL